EPYRLAMTSGSVPTADDLAGKPGQILRSRSGKAISTILNGMRRKKLREFAVANVGSNLMKAVLLDKPGPPSSLRIGEISTPRPGVDEALVRVCATSLNPVDYKVAAQGYEGWNYPHVLGVDIAGVIETLGEGVDSWNLGDRVFYHTTWRKDGSYAEFNVAPAHTFARVPEGIFFVDAATLPCAALTAYCALYRRLHIREGDIVLVHAAAGGVGGFAIQLAKAAKAFVIGTCSAPNTQFHDIGLGGVLASPAFRRRQEDLGRMATELMALVQDGKIRPTVAEQITLEAIPKALERLAERHVRGKIAAGVQN